MTPDVDVVMPVHNEAASIESTLEEWHAELSPLVNFRFILAEDGSKDNTPEVLRRLTARFPMVLDSSDKRRGYAGAMIAGMKRSVAPYVLAVDADGQFDPKDFRKFWEKRDGCPFLIGWASDARRRPPPQDYVRFVQAASSRTFQNETS